MLLYRLLTGKMPYAPQARDQYIPLPEGPHDRSVDHVLAAMLNPNPTERLSNMAMVAERLREVIEMEAERMSVLAIHTPQSKANAKLPPTRARRGPRGEVAGGVALLVLAAPTRPPGSTAGSAAFELKSGSPKPCYKNYASWKDATTSFKDANCTQPVAFLSTVLGYTPSVLQVGGSLSYATSNTPGGGHGLPLGQG